MGPASTWRRPFQGGCGGGRSPSLARCGSSGQAPSTAAIFSPASPAIKSLTPWLSTAPVMCVATLHNGGITVISPDGNRITHVPMPDPVTTNICFGGPGLRTAYITLSQTGSLVRCPGHVLAWRTALCRFPSLSLWERVLAGVRGLQFNRTPSDRHAGCVTSPLVLASSSTSAHCRGSCTPGRVVHSSTRVLGRRGQ